MAFSVSSIPKMIWGLVSFFVAMLSVVSIYPLFTVLLGLHTGFTKVILTLGIFLTVFAVLFLLPYNLMMDKEQEGD